MAPASMRPPLSKARSSAGADDFAAEPLSPEARLTPAMRQYERFKKQHPECVLFFRMGDFYEMFFDDAILCHRVLGITLTERTKGVPMAGVPFHSVEGYLRRMIEQGHRVAVCEQIEDPKLAKGVVERAVTRVLTPGTLVDETLLDESRPNQVAAILFTGSGDDAPAVLAMAELSTGSFTLHDLPADRVADEVARLAPSEVLYVETATGQPPPRVARLREAAPCALTPRPAWTFRPAEARETLFGHFGVATLTGFGLSDDDAAIGPAGALLRYLRETQVGHLSGEARSSDADTASIRRPGRAGGDAAPALALAHLRPPRRERADDFVIIDATSLRALEIERTLRTGGVEGSLLATLQHCRSPMGKRLLRQWLCFPIRDLARLRRRQRAVGAFIQDRDLAEQLSQRLSNVQDVARIAGRLSTGRATPRDLTALGRSVAVIASVNESLAGHPAFDYESKHLAGLAERLVPLAERIGSMCVDGPPGHLREGGLFRDGVDAELDECRLLQRDGHTFLARYQKELIDQTGIASLKVGFNKVFGYYIEVSHANTRRVPDMFSRKQTLKNAERYITPQLKEFEEKITTAEARAIEREQQLFDQLCREALDRVNDLTGYADLIARLDVLLCFAEVATRYRYVKPELVEAPVLSITQGRHPVLDRILADRFVPNDCELGEIRHPSAVSPQPEGDSIQEPGATSHQPTASLALITGPNMAGKSTFIRQVALIVLLAHTGSFVPAEAATIGLTDRIFTRIGAQDELHAGQSTFMVEMTETANILHHATPASVVILDEIGRGTSTLDGLSLAWAVAETLAGVGCRTLFATHYHELTALAERLPAVRNLHVAVREWGAPGHEEIVFLHRILPGRTDRSYGIHVARIAGLPSATVERAQAVLDTLAVQTEHAPVPEAAAPRITPAGAQLSLFTEYVDHPVVRDLKALDLTSLTPMQAFDVLRTLQHRATAKGA